MEGLVVNLVNIYALTTSPKRLQFYQRVSDFLGTLDSHECLVLGGDFNTTLEEQDRSGAELSLAAANILREIVKHHSLVDVWHNHHPDDTSTFTFVRVEAHRSHHSWLDHIYLSCFHLSQAHSSNIWPAPFSDHHLATITASLRAERPGPAYWHFNNSLLEDEGFVMSFREFWLAWREQRRAFPSVWRWWDLGKVRAKLFCRDYTWGTSRRRNAAIEQLEREVLEMERHLAASPEDPFLCGACWEKREELRTLEDHRARGAFVQSCIRLLREMDRGSRFFYALEKTRGAKKHITCLLAEDGAPLTDPVEMCGRAHDFYTSLFSPDPTDPGACRVLWEELPMVSVGDRDRLELPLTLAEFLEALRRMPTNKSPGMDGLTMEIYCAFWDILGPDLATVWAESLQGGVLPLSCRRAVLALLPKKGDLRDLQNWRPVSLLSTDYKIIAKAVSLRLGSVIADVIHPDQTYTVSGHSIFDNLFLVRDLLELGRRDGLSFALLSLDQEKAFDRVDHGYLLGTLQAFGFGPQFVSFLQVLYASAECLVRLNWTLTKPVSFGRGVRQGCPLSGQLYALAIEPFLCLLRRRLMGLVLREPELRLVLSAYADDVLLVVQDPGDLAWVEACQAIYSAASSARVNWVKSSGLAVGDWRRTISNLLLFYRDHIGCLGSRPRPASAGIAVSQRKVRQISDPIQQILIQLHKIIYITQLPPALHCHLKRRVIERFKKSLFSQQSNPCNLKLEVKKLLQGSPELIEPNFFIADCHLLLHSSGGNILAPDDRTGFPGSFDMEEGMTYEQMQSVIEEVLEESGYYNFTSNSFNVTHNVMAYRPGLDRTDLGHFSQSSRSATAAVFFANREEWCLLGSNFLSLFHVKTQLKQKAPLSHSF
ncbi:unnamed protein product [Caretta caretta]